MSFGSNSGQDQVRARGRDAIGHLVQGQENLLSSPEYLMGRDAVQSILANAGRLFTPEMTAGLKANVSADASNAYQGAMGRANERAAASGGFRSGFARDAERRAAVDFGDVISRGFREIDTQIPQLNRQAQLGAIDIANRESQIPYATSQNIANASLGIAGNPIWQQPSSGASLLGGIGQLGGSALGAAGQAGGFGNLFSS